MAVPGRVEAAALLLSLDPPPWFLRHARAVAEVAGWLAARVEAAGRGPDRALVEAAGRGPDRALVETAALLHDVDKLDPPGGPSMGLDHGDGSAAWLAAHGWAALGSAVAAHPVTRLADGPAFDRWLATAPVEDRIVAYADKRAGQRLESMDRRFDAWARRYPPHAATPGWGPATVDAIRERAARLERDVCTLAGVLPGDVRRLAWTGRALRTALRVAELGPGPR
ncbi:MAG: HD domain-containing protein [Chloroflexota bacterium]